MPSPTTGVLDNFNVGADATPPAGWARFAQQASDFTALVASGNVKGPSGDIGFDYLTGNTYGPNSECGITISTLPSSTSDRVFLFLRTANPTNNATRTGYELIWQWVSGASNDIWTISRVDNGTPTSIATFTGQDLAADDKIWFNATGSLLTGYRWNGSAWVSVLSATDATYNSAGYLAMGVEQPDMRVDDFFGGTVVSGVQFDAASSSGYEPALSSYSWSHTCTGTNRGLIVGISIFAAGTVTAVTYAGTNLTFIRAVANGLYRQELWGMPAPASGTNTIAVTLSASLTSIGSAVSYTGVNQTTPFIDSGQAVGTGNPASVVVTPATDNDWIVDGIATSDGSITVGAGQTSRANNSGALGSGAMSDKGPITPASTQTMQWTGIGALDTWAYLAAAVDPFVDLPVYTPALGIVEIRGEVIADWAETPAGDLMLMGVGS